MTAKEPRYSSRRPGVEETSFSLLGPCHIVRMWHAIKVESAAPLVGEEFDFFRPYFEAGVTLTPLRRVLEHAVRSLGVRLALVEEPYFDVEFWESHARTAATTFFESSRRCVRIHLLRADRDRAKAFCRWRAGSDLPEELNDLVGEIQRACRVDGLPRGLSYAGALVLRPPGRTPLGRCLLPPPPDRYIVGLDRQTIHLGGSAHEVRCVPFMQQDRSGGMCVAASLWVASHIGASHFDLQHPSYVRSAMVAAPAEPPWIRADTLDSGLTREETIQAIRHSGARPSVLFDRSEGGRTYPGHRALWHAIYAHVESDIPVVVLGTDREHRAGHAFTIVGHGPIRDFPTDAVRDAWSLRSVLPGIDFKGFHVVAGTIERFCAHDDSRGPYIDLSIRDTWLRRRAGGVSRKRTLPVGSFEIPSGSGSRPSGSVRIDALLAPMPPYVTNRHDEALAEAVLMVERMRCDRDALRRAGFIFAEAGDRVLLRQFLARNTAFKRAFLERHPRPLSIFRVLSRFHLPKYLWVVEFSFFRDRVSEADVLECDVPGERTGTRWIDGEILLDTTSGNEKPSVLWARLGNHIRILKSRLPDTFETIRTVSSPAPEEVQRGFRVTCHAGSPQRFRFSGDDSRRRPCP